MARAGWGRAISPRPPSGGGTETDYFICACCGGKQHYVRQPVGAGPGMGTMIMEDCPNGCDWRDYDTRRVVCSKYPAHPHGGSANKKEG